MALTDKDLREIVARSSRLSERLTNAFTFTATEKPKAKGRLERMQLLAPALLESVKGEAAGQEDGVLGLLDKATMEEACLLPMWATMLGRLSAAIQRHSCKKAIPKSARSAFPFQDLFRPMVAFARAQVDAQAGTALDRMHPRAWRGLERQLSSRLSSVCSLALQADFLAYKALHGSSSWNSLFGIPNNFVERHGGYYDRFIANQKDNGLATFFCRYPTASRLCAHLIQDWICWVGEFLQRLGADWIDIGVLSSRLDRSEHVIDVTAGISDPHNGGRSALIATFDGGAKVVYKPRSLSVEESFFKLLEWHNEQEGSVQHRTLRILARSGYGWMEFVRFRQCDTPDEICGFYERAGSLIALVHAFRGVDIHRENIVADGEYPVIIDLEGLCHPRNPRKRPAEPIPIGGADIDETLLRTGLLPLFHKLPAKKRSIDISGLGAPMKIRGLIPSLLWRKANTDDMQAEASGKVMACRSHRPRISGKAANPAQFADVIADAFLQTTAFLREQSNNVSFQQRTAAVLQSPKRIIRRPTFVYAVLLRALQSPAFMIEGIDRSIELHTLPFGGVQDDAELYASEIKALENLDLPYFSAPMSNSSADQLFLLSSAQALEQAAIIRLSFRRRLRVIAGSVDLG